MSDHDPLCPAYRPGPLRAICECTLITKTAERERERIAPMMKALSEELLNARADERERMTKGLIDASGIGNSIAAATAMYERERIAQAIEAAEPVGWNMVARKDAARIARNGGRDE